MKIDVFERIKNDKIDLVRFVLDGVSVELANALRRLILTEVPTMAINEVLFVENDGVLYDEMIAHRIGLIPLTSDIKNYNLPDECSCGGQGCTLCQAQLMCEVQAETDERTVYSRDLESMDPKIHPINGDLIITKMGKRTSLVFEAYAQLGIGKDHAKFQPVCSIGYKYFPEVAIDNSKIKPEEVDEIVKKDHTKLFTKENGKLGLIKDYYKGADFVTSVEKYCEPGGIVVGFTPNKFIFSVEGTGALPLKEVFIKGVEIFIEKLDEFELQLKDVKITQPVIAE